MTGVLNTDKGYVFIHVPKCAGFSISRLLLKCEQATRFHEIPALAEAVQRENAISSEIVGDTSHARARDIREVLGRDAYDRLESFAVVRNPLERLKSRYHFLRERKNRPIREHLKGSFSEFVLWSCANRPATMSGRLTDRKGNIIVKHILKFENIECEFKTFATQILHEDFTLPFLNVSSNQKNPVEYSEEAIEAARHAYRKDFSLFGYSDMYPAA